MQSSCSINLEKRLLSLVQQNKQQTNLSIDNVQNQSIQKKYSGNSLTIAYTVIQKLPITIKKVLEQNFQNIVHLTIVNCDLRTFQNFPKLKSLKDVNASKNSLRGSFQYLVKNRTIKYIDVSYNIIGDIKRFQPLKYLKDIRLYAKNNPFDTIGSQSSKNNIEQQLKNFGIKYLSKPLTTDKQTKKQENLEKYDAIIQDINSKKSHIKQKLEKQRQKQRQRQRQRLQRMRSSQGIIQSLHQSDLLRFMRFTNRKSQFQQSNPNNNTSLRLTLPRLAIINNNPLARSQRNQANPAPSRLEFMRGDSSQYQHIRLQSDNINFLLPDRSEEQDDDQELDLNDQQQYQIFQALEAEQEQQEDQQRFEVRLREFGQMRRVLSRLHSDLNQNQDDFVIESDSDSLSEEQQNNS